MIITVQSIKPTSGRGPTVIMTTDGRRLGVWQDLAGIFSEGGSYDVAIEESQKDGRTFHTIRKAAPAAAPASSAAAPHQPAAATFRTPEQMFVSEVLTAYIANGRCEPQKLTETISYIRRAWGQTFGGAPITGYRQAAE